MARHKKTERKRELERRRHRRKKRLKARAKELLSQVEISDSSQADGMAEKPATEKAKVTVKRKAAKKPGPKKADHSI